MVSPGFVTCVKHAQKNVSLHISQGDQHAPNTPIPYTVKQENNVLNENDVLFK